MILNAYKKTFKFIKDNKFTFLTALGVSVFVYFVYLSTYPITTYNFEESELLLQYHNSKADFLSIIGSSFLFTLYFCLKSCFVCIIAGFMPLFFLSAAELVFICNISVLSFGFTVSVNSLVFSDYITSVVPYTFFEFLFYTLSFALSLVLSKEMSKLILYYSPFRETFADKFKNGLKPHFKETIRNIGYCFTLYIMPLVLIGAVLYCVLPYFAI